MNGVLKFIVGEGKVVNIMAGLGLFLYGALRAICGIGQAVENKQMKDYSYKIDEKGRPTWIDRQGNQYINGEKVVATYDYNNHKLVYSGKRTGTVYIDPEQNQKDRLDRWSEERKQYAINNGDLAYNKYNHVWKKEITTEISTGRPIAELIKNSDGTYWKIYGTIDSPKNEWDFYVGCQHKTGEPIQITREEFSKLNTVGGSHLVLR